MYDEMDPTLTTPIDPPYDLQGEESTLGSLMLDGEKIGIISGILNADDFYREKNRWVYEAMLAIDARREHVNQITVGFELSKTKKLEAVGGADYLAFLVHQVPTTVHLMHYARVVQKCSTLRKLIVLGQYIQKQGLAAKDLDEALGEVESALSRFRGQGQSKVITPYDWANEADQRYGKLRDKTSRAVPFGVPLLDSVMGGGAFGGEYILVGARPSMGKSTLLDQFAVSFQNHGNVLIAQAEMSKSQMMDREVAALTGKSIVTIRAGGYDEKTHGQIVDALGLMAERRIFRYIDGYMTTRSLRSVAMQVNAEYGLDAIVVDYLGILKDNPSMKPYERITHISSQLLALTNDLDVPMVVAVQLNRGVDERSNRRPMLSDLRDSGTLEQDADVVMFLYRADAYHDFEDDKCPPGQAELNIAKHRQGGGLKTVRLKYLKESQKYGELAR